MTISTHTPLAGRDDIYALLAIMGHISTHTPLAGRDKKSDAFLRIYNISTHTPLAGRDVLDRLRCQGRWHFYSHAPCGT